MRNYVGALVQEFIATRQGTQPENVVADALRTIPVHLDRRHFKKKLHMDETEYRWRPNEMVAVSRYFCCAMSEIVTKGSVLRWHY